MELFGLVVVDDAPAEPRKGWRIADVRSTEWGEALHAVLLASLAEHWDDVWFDPYMDERPHTPEVRIGDLPLQPGAQMLYHYDFGDDWKFDVVLERIDPPDPDVRGYQIEERKGKSPEQYHHW